MAALTIKSLPAPVEVRAMVPLDPAVMALFTVIEPAEATTAMVPRALVVTMPVVILPVEAV